MIIARQRKSSAMPRRREDVLKQARERITRIQAMLSAMDYLCSGTLDRRTKVCGKPNCHCAEDPSARHGPYYEWGHMKGGKLVHRVVSPDQAALLRLAITNYRKAKKLLRAWECETERLIDSEVPREP
jgi:hypothetical protein